MAATQTIGTVNDEGQNVDLYIPRKCHASRRLIPAFDHGAIQIAIGDVDENGLYTGTSRILCISGFLRSQGESDHAINHLCIGNGIIRGRTARQPKWLKKRQSEARKKFAPKTRGGRRVPGKAGGRGVGGKRPGGKGGAGRPAGKGGVRPAGKAGERGPRPAGKQGERPARGPRPEGKQGERPARGPRPEGAGKRPPRPEGKQGERPARPEGAKGAPRQNTEGKRPPRPAAQGKRPAAATQ